MPQAIGCLEVLGYSVLVDALDQACKSSNIKILGIDCNNPSKGELALIPNVFQAKISGDLSQVEVALEVARKQARLVLDEQDIITHILTKKTTGIDIVINQGKIRKIKN